MPQIDLELVLSTTSTIDMILKVIGVLDRLQGEDEYDPHQPRAAGARRDVGRERDALRPCVDPRETSPPMLATARRRRGVAARTAEPGAMAPR